MLLLLLQSCGPGKHEKKSRASENRCCEALPIFSYRLDLAAMTRSAAFLFLDAVTLSTSSLSERSSTPLLLLAKGSLRLPAPAPAPLSPEERLPRRPRRPPLPPPPSSLTFCSLA